MKLTIDSKLELTHGVNQPLPIPLLGFGTWPMKGQTCKQAVKWALNAGYRLIDTAAYYNNEKEVGQAIRESDIPREEIFVTTKLWNSDQGYDNTLKAFKQSLDRLNLDYIDLYLIHWPSGRHDPETWTAFEELLDTDQLKAIGVSNYEVSHLTDLLDNSDTIPAVNQINLSPYKFPRQNDVIDFCNNNNIHIEAYSPLTKGNKLNDQKLESIAAKYEKSTAQLLIRWALEHHFIVIPKSSKKERIFENSDIFDFDITPKDMDVLDSITT